MPAMIKKYGRTVIVMIVSVLAMVFGDVDYTNLESFLLTVIEEGTISLGAALTTLAHYFGQIKFRVFEPEA